ncbi:MAG: hypothetical protein ABR582_04120 [Gemmatimonadaceae bacterium]
MVTDAGLRAALTTGLDTPVSPRAEELIRYITQAFGPSTAAIIHYGSRAQKSGSRPDSAYDFFVIVDDYEPAFLSFAAQVHPQFGARSAIILSRFLPPSIVALTRLPGAGTKDTAKCAVLSLRDLAIACSSDSPDHFTKGRLFQQLQLAWSRDENARIAVEDAVVAARAGTFEWGAPYLHGRFDVDKYSRTLLATSYAGEIRPETQSRIDELAAAQRLAMAEIYGVLLASLEARGFLARHDVEYELTPPPSATDAARIESYFRRSKARATMRWVKLIWLYDDWLEYIRQKIGRRAGHVIDLTPQERRWPWLLLWPKLIRYISSRR